MKDQLTAAVYNFTPVPGGKAENLKRMKEAAVKACEQGAKLILMPEMALTGADFYVYADVTPEERLAVTEEADGPAAREMAEISKEYGAYIVYGGPERVKDGGGWKLFNSAYVSGPEGRIGTFHKIHPYGKENTVFVKGDTPMLIETPWGPVGVGICYDVYHFPELMRYYIAKGARLLLNPTAVGERVLHPGWREAFLEYYRLLDGIVIRETVFVMSANLTGREGGYLWSGGSCILGPMDAPYDDTVCECFAGNPDDLEERLSVGTIDLGRAKRPQFTVNPYTGTPDFRPELYAKWYAELAEDQAKAGQ